MACVLEIAVDYVIKMNTRGGRYTGRDNCGFFTFRTPKLRPLWLYQTLQRSQESQYSNVDSRELKINEASESLRGVSDSHKERRIERCRYVNL